MAIGDYCTQMAPDGSGHEACGAACLASVALSNGWESDPWELTKEIAFKYGIVDRGATSEQLIQAAEDYELDGSKWYAWSECTAQLAAEGAVLCLLDNSHLSPRPYPSGSSWNAMHWIRACAVAENGKMVYVYDPLTYMQQPDGTVYQNPTVVTQESLWEGIMATGYPEAGIILISKTYRNLNEFK
jgi:hypothetical protein